MRSRQIYLTLLFLFLVGNHKGFIALWTDMKDDPVCVYPYSIASLPPADQKTLNEGIFLESESELSQILEDFLS